MLLLSHKGDKTTHIPICQTADIYSLLPCYSLCRDMLFGQQKPYLVLPVPFLCLAIYYDMKALPK